MTTDRLCWHSRANLLPYSSIRPVCNRYNRHHHFCSIRRGALPHSLFDINISLPYGKLTKETTSSASKPIALEHIDDTSMEEGLLARSEGLSVGAIGHVSVDDFMLGVASPSLKRTSSPRPREDATVLLGDKELSVEKSVLEK